MRRDATLEKIWRMLNGNGKPRKSTSCSTKRMAATLLALTWPWHFMALTLTTLQRTMQLPDVRDAPLNDDNAAASSTDVKPRWRNWDEDYAMGYQRHP